jgi:LysM repeat protein
VRSSPGPVRLALPSLVSAILVAGAVGCGGTDPDPTVAIPVLVVVTPAPTSAATPRPGVTRRYTVRAGDTLSGIAGVFGVAEDAIAEANGLGDRDRLFEGQELVIPPPAPVPAAGP